MNWGIVLPLLEFQHQRINRVGIEITTLFAKYRLFFLSLGNFEDNPTIQKNEKNQSCPKRLN
jgi:hypothetical protein